MIRKLIATVSVILILGVSAIAIVRAQDLTWRNPNNVGREPAAFQPPAGDIQQVQATSVLKKSSRSGPLAERLQSLRSKTPKTAKAPDGATDEMDVEIDTGVEVDADTELKPSPRTATTDSSSGLPSVLKRKTRTSSPKLPATEPEESAITADAPPAHRTAQVPRTIPSVPETQALQNDQPSPSDEPQFSSSSGGALISSVGPALRVETAGPPAVMVGKPATYVLTVFNDGRVAAQDVHVRIAVPGSVNVTAAEATVGSARRQEEGGQDRLVWIINELEPRSQQQLTLQLLPREGRAFDLNVDWIFRPVSASAHVDVQQAQLEMSLAGPKDAQYGAPLTYIITLSNPGNGDAENVLVKLAAGQNAQENIEVGGIPAGQQKQIEVQLTANQVGRMTIKADATADGGLQSEVAEEVTVRRAELQVAVTAPRAKYAGSEAVFQIRVANAGNATAEDVLTNVTLPAGAKLTAMTDGAKQSANVLTWKIGSLGPNAERVFDVRCELTTAGDNRVDARVQAAGGLIVSENAVTKVEALADLKLVVNEPKGPRPLGEEVTYEVIVANRGTKSAHDVNVVVQFSEGLEPIATEGLQAELAAGQAIFRPIQRLDAGQQIVLKVKARSEKAGSQLFRTEVKCSEPETRLVFEGTTRFFGEEPEQANSPQPTKARR